MPATKSRTPRFKTLQQFELEYAPVKITHYESTRTGMRAVVVDQKGPKVSGHFALATEIHDDSGAPHTLEHLCFLGSKSYPFKGLLDKLATRSYSTTNAYTTVDQTTYTLTTAGWDGFAQVLPVYLEHLIVPTLTDAGCYTEVHHIDGTGHDAGVVYSEMQGVQNNQAELMELRAKRLLYPEGNGFRYETGGMMEQLRVLTAARIRNFHKEMYQPKNMCLILAGEVDHAELLQILDDFEETIKDDVPSFDAPFKRPWVDADSIPELEESVVETVSFPEEDESMGEIMITFHGPSCNDQLAVAAMGVLLIYLCGSSISVMENILVEKEQLCSCVVYQLDYRPKMNICFGFSAVETAKLAHVEKRVFELLRETAAKELNMNYMHDCIKRWRRQIKQRCENAGSFFFSPIIEDHLYGHRDGRDLKTLATIEELNVLESWTDRQWRTFLSTWISDAKHVSILGEPSKEMSERITEKEKARVKAQQESLGEAKMKELAAKLDRAKAENEKPIPDALLEQFPLPNTDSVHFIPTVTARSGAARQMGKLNNHIQQIIDKDDDGAPLFIHFEHIPSNFVRVRVEISTASIPVERKPLMSLYMTNLFTTPVKHNGRQISFEDLVMELEKETNSYGIDAEDGHRQVLCLSLSTEPENYQNAIVWIKTVLFDAVHDPVRLNASLTKLLADIPDEKRDGESMLYAANSMIEYTLESGARARNTLVKGLYLKRIKKMLRKDPESVTKQFSEVCAAMHRPENFRIGVAADLEKLPKPVSAWHALSSGLTFDKPLEPLPDQEELLSKIGRNPGKAAYIIPIAATDSSFALITAKGPKGLEHPDFPALLVAQSYMNATEGPLWASVRGTGLAYGISFSRVPQTGLVSLDIYRSPNTYEAYAAAKQQLEGYASGSLRLEKFALEGAISDIVLSMANEQPTMASAAEASFLNQVIRGISKDWEHQLLRKTRELKPEQIKEAMAKYLLPIFRPETANLMITCAPIMKESLLEKFTAAGFKPEVKALDDLQDDYGVKAIDGEDEGSDDEDSDVDGMDDDEGVESRSSDDVA